MIEKTLTRGGPGRLALLVPSLEGRGRGEALQVRRRQGNTLKELEREAARAGRGRQFKCLAPLLTGDETPYKFVGEQLALSEAAVKVAVHRLRRQFAKALREQIADTVESPEAVDDELRYLLRVITDAGPTIKAL